MTCPWIFLIPATLSARVHLANRLSVFIVILSPDAMVGSPPPMMYRSPWRVPLLMYPEYPSLVEKRNDGPRPLMAKPVEISLVLDAGISLRELLNSAIVSPFAVTARTPTSPDLKGSSCIFMSMYFCAAVCLSPVCPSIVANPDSIIMHATAILCILLIFHDFYFAKILTF